MNTGRTVARLGTMMLTPRRGADRAGMALAVVAWAVVTALSLSVVGGALWFHDLGSPGSSRPNVEQMDQDAYSGLATLAVVLLLVPLISLGGAAARLAARRRDERLSSLSLLGADRTTLLGLTVAESTMLAAVGCVVGFGGYLALMPVFGLVPFVGGPIGAAALWPGVIPVLLTMAGMMLVAVISSFSGLRSIVITPLGVRTRENAPPAPWRALGIGLLLLLVVVVASRSTENIEQVAVLVVIGGMFAGALAVLNLIAPFVLRLLGRWQLRRASGPHQLIAARTVLEDPKGLWRQIGGVAMTSLVAVVAGTGFAMVSDVDGQDFVTQDTRTGVLLTVAISFVTVACSVGINQTASVLDRADLYRSLYRVGMGESVMNRARSRAVMPALLTVAFGAAGLGMLLVVPLAGVMLVTASQSMLVIGAVLTAGILAVYAALLSTRPVLRSALTARDHSRAA